MGMNDIVLSRITTVALNIIQCALFVFAFIVFPTGGSERHLVGYLAPFVPPAVTLLFLLGKSPGPALAAIAVVLNLVSVFLGFLLLYLLSDALTPLLVLAIGVSGMLIPAISMLSVAIRWPRVQAPPQVPNPQ
jgi:hypothetical protein